MALKSRGWLFTVVPWHPTEILEQTEPLPVVSVVYILVLNAVTQIRVLSSALFRLILIYEARLKIGEEMGRDAFPSLCVCLGPSL